MGIWGCVCKFLRVRKLIQCKFIAMFTKCDFYINLRGENDTVSSTDRSILFRVLDFALAAENAANRLLKNGTYFSLHVEVVIKV